MAGQISLDDVDRRMLRELEVDGRLSINELARRVSVSRATAYTRFDRLVESGVITGFHAAIDPAALGNSLAALILLDIDQGDWPHALPTLAALPGVEHVALTAGDFDVTMFVRVPDVHALRDLLLVRLRDLPEVRSTKTVFVLDEVGRQRGAPATQRGAPATQR